MALSNQSLGYSTDIATIIPRFNSQFQNHKPHQFVFQIIKIAVVNKLPLHTEMEKTHDSI